MDTQIVVAKKIFQHIRVKEWTNQLHETLVAHTARRFIDRKKSRDGITYAIRDLTQ
jgi:hypothetical protein